MYPLAASAHPLDSFLRKVAEKSLTAVYFLYPVDLCTPLPQPARRSTGASSGSSILGRLKGLAGSFGGATLYHDAGLVLPNEARQRERLDLKRGGSKYERRKEAQAARREHVAHELLAEGEDAPVPEHAGIPCLERPACSVRLG